MRRSVLVMAAVIAMLSSAAYGGLVISANAGSSALAETPAKILVYGPTSGGLAGPRRTPR